MVPFVRGSFFAGEHVHGLADAQRRAGVVRRAGRAADPPDHACRPAELFAAEEAPRLLPAPVMPYDLPVYATAKVHRDHHIEVAKALYSVPGEPDRPATSRCAPTLSWSASTTAACWSRSIPDPARRPGHRPRGPARRTRPPTPCATSTTCSGWPMTPAGDRRLRRGAAGPPAAVDQDAAGLRPARPGPQVGAGTGRRRLRPGAGSRGSQRPADRPDAGARHRARQPAAAALPCPAGQPRFARDPAHFAVPQPTATAGGAA